MYTEKLLLWVWMNSKKLILWSSWILTSLVLIVAFAAYFLGKDQTRLLPGKTTEGHYQIEQNCALCHTPFDRIKQEACLDCHELEDSHSKQKMLEAEAELPTWIDSCTHCHQEHRQTIARVMGVTIAPYFCKSCHQDIAQKRTSHEGMAFDTCRTCHNYHDNTALNEDFLLKNLHQPDTFDNPKVPQRNFLDIYRTKHPIKRLTMKEHDAPEGGYGLRGRDWEGTSHANAGVNCMPCHSLDQTIPKEEAWVENADHRFCEDCHPHEVSGFLAGKHGIRIAKGLSPMTTDMARQTMKSIHKALNCMSCHEAHEFSTEPQKVGVDSCLSCHDDEHSRAYKSSPHYSSWDEKTTEPVTCATCHLPRIVKENQTVVEHNPSFNLHPRQKMLKTVCLHCHGLGYSLDALADNELVRNNFPEAPSKHIESLEMVEEKQRKN